jgi:hypothetical protein
MNNMNDVTLPPSLGTQFDALWKAFQSAVAAFATRIDELRVTEQLAAPCEDYASVLKASNLFDRNAIFLTVARDIRDCLIAKACVRFAPDGATLEIDHHKIHERFPLDHNSGTESFNPVAIWDFLVSQYDGDAGKAIAWRQAADALTRSFGLNRQTEVKTKSGCVILELSVYTEKHFRGYWELSYSSRESVSKALLNLVAFARWANFDELADECASAAAIGYRQRDEVSSRQRFSLGDGCEYVTYLQRFEFRLAAKVAEQLQIFLATFATMGES